MSKYKLKVLQNFKDKYTSKSYVANQVIEVEEERAFELLSSDLHLVKYVSREEAKNGNSNAEIKALKEEITTLKADNDAVVAENDTVKAENEALKEEITTLKAENEDLKGKVAATDATDSSSENSDDKNKNK